LGYIKKIALIPILIAALTLSVCPLHSDQEAFAYQPDQPDQSEIWQERMTLGKGEVTLILEKGRLLPTSLYTMKVTLRCERLGTAFILGSGPAPTPTPSPTPKPEPTKPPPIPNVPPQNGDIDPSKPMVALTFDDGPSIYTARILDLLERYNARATFCVVGNLVGARVEVLERAIGIGCEVVGHSWDHADMSKLGAAGVKAQIEDSAALIESVTGVWPRLYRPPYGAVSETMKRVSAEQGYAILYWSVDPMDWLYRDAGTTYGRIMGAVYDRSIVLSHDLYLSTADAMERVVPELLARGYQLVTVSELMYYSGVTLEAGKVYYDGR